MNVRHEGTRPPGLKKGPAKAGVRPWSQKNDSFCFSVTQLAPLAVTKPGRDRFGYPDPARSARGHKTGEG